MESKLKITPEHSYLGRIMNSKDQFEQVQVLEEYKKSIAEPYEEIIGNLTSNIPLQDLRKRLIDVMRTPYGDRTKESYINKVKNRWSRLFREYSTVKGINLDLRIERYDQSKGRKYRTSYLDYIQYQLGDLELLYKIAVGLFRSDFIRKQEKYLADLKS